MKLMILGHARHGKDTVAEYFSEFLGLSFTSSSRVVAELLLPDINYERGTGYKTVEECYSDRYNYRGYWFNWIVNYNKEDLAKLGKLIYSQNDMYVGLRNEKELYALHNLNIIDLTIWVDASLRLPPEPVSSITVKRQHADIVIDNNGYQLVLERRIKRLCKLLERHHDKGGADVHKDHSR